MLDDSKEGYALQSALGHVAQPGLCEGERPVSGRVDDTDGPARLGTGKGCWNAGLTRGGLDGDGRHPTCAGIRRPHLIERQGQHECPACHGRDRSHRQRLVPQAGLTGLWQVSGRTTLSFEEMVQLDIVYGQRRSLALDLEILLKTVPAVLSRDGAW